MAFVNDPTNSAGAGACSADAHTMGLKHRGNPSAASRILMQLLIRLQVDQH